MARMIPAHHTADETIRERSLIWKPPPHVVQRVPGWVEGYVRRFWQSSNDHRGTAEAPGRVVTLLKRSFWETLADHHRLPSAHKVWGVAYLVPADKVSAVMDYLDVREVCGYSVDYTSFHPADGSAPFPALMYIGTPENPHFLGPQDPQVLASRIYQSSGPSGLNKDYLFDLESALTGLCDQSGDEHVTDLANRVRAMESFPLSAFVAAGGAGELRA